MAYRLAVAAGVVFVILVSLFGWWKRQINNNGGEPAEPFRIAGNFYYVGTNDSAVFLITGPQGHVLLDGGRQGAAPLVIASIATLGFDITDVKAIVNSDPLPDHAGAFATLKQSSGAALWASAPSARAIAAGGDDPDMPLPVRALMRGGIADYPPARVDHELKDGDTVRVGPVALTAHITGGTTRGCTSWTFAVRDGDRVLNVVSACQFSGFSSTPYSGHDADVERSLGLLRKLPVDIWVTSNGRPWGRYRKFAASRTMKNPVDAFIDRDGYQAFLDAAEAELRTGVVH